MKISAKLLLVVVIMAVIALFWGGIYRVGQVMIARFTPGAVRLALPAEVLALEGEKIDLQRDEIAYQREKIKLKRTNLARNDRMRLYGVVTLLASCCSGVLIVSSAHARATIRRASIYMIKIGQHTEFPVHIRQIQQGALAEQLTALTTAEQLRAYSDGQQRAFDIYQALAETQVRHLRALPGTLTPLLDVTPPAAPRTVPSFAEMLRAGVIAPGKPMILGYVNGVARPGSFLDIYSAAVAGASGSGKTGTLLYLIGSGIVAEHVRFYGIDPHYPHPKSLGFKTKPLWDAGLMHMATYLDDMRAVLRTVEKTIERRLQQLDTETTPVVLVIDELAFLAKSSIGGSIAHTMERISTEGRKCAVYLLASSQTWLVARTGDSSVVRDTLTSAFVHRIKPKQANLLLQDKDEAEKVKRFIRHPGEVLLCPVNDESMICQMPYTTDADMHRVVALARDQYRDTGDTAATQADTPATQADTPATQADTPATQADTDILVSALHVCANDKKALSARAGVSLSLIKEIQAGRRRLTADTRHKLVTVMQQQKQESNHEAVY